MWLVLPPLFSNNKTRNLFAPWKLGLIKKSIYWFCYCTVTFGWYLFQLIVLLKPAYNCSISFALSWVEKVTTGTLSLVSAIVNVVSWLSIR